MNKNIVHYTTTLVCRKNKIRATVNGQLGLFQSSIKINITIIQDLLNGILFTQKYI